MNPDNPTINSSTKDSKSIDYLVLTLDELEYKKLNPNEKKELLFKENIYLKDNCPNCNIDLDLYKQVYYVKNQEIYEKKNISQNKRYKEYFYVYTQCRLCDDKKRLSDRIYYEPIIQKEPTIFHKIYKWFLG